MHYLCTIVRHSCETPIGDALPRHSCGTLTWSTRFWHSKHTLCKHSWDPPRGNSSETLLWDALAAHSLKTLFWDSPVVDTIARHWLKTLCWNWNTWNTLRDTLLRGSSLDTFVKRLFGDDSLKTLWWYKAVQHVSRHSYLKLLQDTPLSVYHAMICTWSLLHLCAANRPHLQHIQNWPSLSFPKAQQGAQHSRRANGKARSSQF